MPQGISIHIGLNRVDPNAYGGWNGALSGCINDAQAMLNIAQQMGYTPTILLDEQATSSRVIEEIGRAAQSLSSGDILLLTYSGHGGQINDMNGDEDDAKDETWVFYDRMLIDDELYALWSQFNEGVRIFMLSDSCHSGTVSRFAEYRSLYDTQSKPNKSLPTFRSIPSEIARRFYEQNKSMLNTLQWAAGRKERSEIRSSILLISGCQDNQLSSDGNNNGLFTSKLIEVWNNGSFNGDYPKFWKAILQKMPIEQSPNYFLVGASNPAFERERPFTINSTNGPIDTSTPSVTGPGSWSRSATAPTFNVNTGANRYYIFEITSQPNLFDIMTHGWERTPQTFYGTWADRNAPSRLTAPQFTLPNSVWQLLKNADRLYYRIGTTSSLTGWDNYTTSTSDFAGQSTPSMHITPTGQSMSEPTLRRGDTGESVKRLQRLLQNKGYSVTVDGIFGLGTERVVKMFQSDSRLTADGVVGPATWAALGRSRVRVKAQS